MKHLMYESLILLLAVPAVVVAETGIDYGTELNVVIDPYIAPGQYLILDDPIYNIPDYDMFIRCQDLRVLADERRSPVWSPDGRKIAIADGHNDAMWIVPATGGDPVPIDNDYRHDPGAYTWSEENQRWQGQFDMSKLYYHKDGYVHLKYAPDGSEIYFMTSIYDVGRAGNSDSLSVKGYIPSIERIDLTTGEKRTVIEEGSTFDISSNGRFIAYCHFDSRIYKDVAHAEHNGALAVLDMATGTTRFLTDFDSTQPYDRDRAVCMSISPDNSTIAFTTSSQVFLIPFEGGEPVQISNFDNSKDNLIAIGTCEYSPDGKWLLLERGGTLVVIDLESNTAFDALSGDVYDQQFSKSSGEREYFPAWSPDGSKICYVRNDTPRYREDLTYGEYIYVVGFDPEKYTIGKDSPNLVENEKPAGFGIAGNFPNPFNPATTIEFSLADNAAVSLDIYNTAGQKVRGLINETMNIGKYSAVWDGRDDSGAVVSSGVYIARLRSGNSITAKQMVLMK